VRPYQFAPDHFEQQGWEGQLRRVERWHERAVHVLDLYSGVAGEEAIDFLYAFFQSAYHMRDWLQHSGAASKASLDALMSANRCLNVIDIDTDLPIEHAPNDMFRHAGTAGAYLEDLVCEIVCQVLAADADIRAEDKSRHRAAKA
jgi:hypothetical protein